MEYNDIDEAILPFLEVSREQYESYPAFVRQATVQLARQQWLDAGSPRADALRYPIQESIADDNISAMPMDEQIDYYYERNIRRSTMGIEDYRFTLRNTLNVPTAWQYVNMIAYKARELDATNATVEYSSNDDEIYHLSLSRDDLRNHDPQELLEMLKKGSSNWEDEFYSGSDYIKECIASYSLSKTHFTITVSHVQGGYGKMIPDYYHTLGLENNSDDCLIQCFIYINHLQHLSKPTMDVDDIRKLLSKQGKLGVDAIPVLEDLFKIKVDVLRDHRHLEFDTRRNIGRDISLIDSIQTVITKDEPVIIYGAGDNKWQLLYKDNHFDVITKTLQASDCHCPHTGNFVGYAHGYSRKQLIRELKKKFQPDSENLTQYDGSDNEDDNEVWYYFFDYETVFDPITMEIIPYAYAIVKCDKQFNVVDTQCQLGLGCEKQLSDYLFRESPTQDEKKYLIGYNNSRFDNYFLLKQAFRNNDYVGYTRFAGNSIISASVNKFVVRDLCRILNMPLDKACKDFKIAMPKLTNAIKHHHIQLQYIKGDLNQYIAEMHNTIRTYVIRDCVCLVELYKSTKESTQQLLHVDVENYYTLAGMSYAAFKKTIDEKNLPVLNKDHERHDRFVRKAIVGGRAQMQCTKRTQNDLYAIDCVSLYPYVMMNREYPIGMPIDTNEYIPNKIGVYHVTVRSQQEHTLNVIPLRDENTRRLNWSYKGEIQCVLSSVDIECLKRHGGCVDVHDGIYWEKTTNKLFDQYFKPLIAEKMKQDHYKETNDPRYNPAVRETTKLKMNALSGKLAQKLHNTVTSIMRNASDVDRFYTSTIPGTQTFVRLGSAYIAQGKKNAMATTPCVYGVLIYAYAREHMYESVLKHLSPEELYGMDTDSAFITKECLERIDPMLIGSDFGQFKIEVGDCDGIFIAPKCYAFYIDDYTMIDEDDKTITIKHKKGVTTYDKDKIIIDSENKFIVKARFKGVAIGKDVVVSESEEEDKIELYKKYHDTRSKRLGLHSYEKLLNDNECYVLCCNIEKTALSSHKNVGLYIANHVFIKHMRVEQGHIEVACDDSNTITVLI
jgi:hypothetical protein